MEKSCCRFLFGLLIFPAVFSTARAAWNDPVTNTPAIVQIDFGAYGQNLPGNGEDYCQPTSAVMSLFWLGSNGFTQLAPAVYPGQDSSVTRNLELVIAGLMSTSSNGGTTDGNAIHGLEDYLSAAGIGTSQYSHIYTTTPDLAWFSTALASNAGANPTSITFANFGIGWYDAVGSSTTVYSASGGHELALLTTDVPNSNLIINNAYPNALINGVPNIPSSDPQTVGISSVPSGWTLPGLSQSQDYTQLQTNKVGDGSTLKAILDGAYAWTIQNSALPGSPGYALQPWEIGGVTTAPKKINTNGGTFTVQAPVVDGVTPGSFDKVGQGTLLLTNTNTTTGVNTVEGGTLASSYNVGSAATPGTPFGTGSMILQDNGSLQFMPVGSGSDLVFTLAGGSGQTLSIGSGGGQLLLRPGGNSSLAVIVGGNTDGTSPNLVRTSNTSATLVIAPQGGLSALGHTERVVINGSAGNLPANTNGIAAPYLVGQDNNANKSGSFLVYNSIPVTPGDPLTAPGFQAASLPTFDATSSDGNVVYNVTSNQTITSGTAATAGLQVQDGFTVNGPGRLQIGATGSPAGLILNGGSITAADLSFGNGSTAVEGTIYTSLANATISSRITGTGGLTSFGPGTLTLTGNNAATLSGPVNVNSGTLVAANSSSTDSATGTGAVNIHSGATLQIAGPNSAVSGNIDVTNAGTLLLSGGTAANVHVAGISADNANPGGILAGYGAITGTANIAGTIEAGPTIGTLVFSGAADLSGSDYFWQLDSLVDDSTTAAGIDWNLSTFTGAATLGTSDNSLNLFVSFGAGLDPDSGNSFWNSDHEWELWDVSEATSFTHSLALGNVDYNVGNFSTTELLVPGEIILKFKAAPVPEPSTMALAALGGILLLISSRRNRVPSCA